MYTWKISNKDFVITGSNESIGMQCEEGGGAKINASIFKGR